MIIKIENSGLIVTIEDKSAESMEDVFPLIKQALLGLGFHYKTVEEWFPEE